MKTIGFFLQISNLVFMVSDYLLMNSNKVLELIEHLKSHIWITGVSLYSLFDNLYLPDLFYNLWSCLMNLHFRLWCILQLFNLNTHLSLLFGEKLNSLLEYIKTILHAKQIIEVEGELCFELLIIICRLKTGSGPIKHILFLVLDRHIFLVFYFVFHLHNNFILF